MSILFAPSHIKGRHLFKMANTASAEYPTHCFLALIWAAKLTMDRNIFALACCHSHWPSMPPLWFTSASAVSPLGGCKGIAGATDGGISSATPSGTGGGISGGAAAGCGSDAGGASWKGAGDCGGAAGGEGAGKGGIGAAGAKDGTPSGKRDCGNEGGGNGGSTGASCAGVEGGGDGAGGNGGESDSGLLSNCLRCVAHP